MPLTSNSPAPALGKRSTKVVMGVASLFWIAALLGAVNAPLAAQAAPTVDKHKQALNNVINAMSFKVSETDALPIQLQIEANVKGAQKLAYPPENGTPIDFYYLNYRPVYRAGASTIDFWMHSPKGAQIPKSASLDLYDEFGKIKLMNIVPEGTPIPQGGAAANGEPYLWKSWKIPGSIKSEFDFSEKFRVILTTADDVQVAKARKVQEVIAASSVEDDEEEDGGKKKKKNKKNKNRKRYYESIVFPIYDFFSKNKNKSRIEEADPSQPNVLQDRVFRIKGLKAAPGGHPNPAKVNVNAIVPNSALPKVDGRKKDTNDAQFGKDGSTSSQGMDRDSPIGAANIAAPQSRAVFTLLAISLSYILVMLL